MSLSPQGEYLEELNLYTEIKTSRIYEGKLFEDFVIVRPVLPQFWGDIRKVALTDFGMEFDDFHGNRAEMRAFIQGYVDLEMEATVQ